MLTRTRRSAMRLVSPVLPERTQQYLVRRFSKPLMDAFAKFTDEFLELLLHGMDLAFCLSGSYRKNIEDFRAVYAFKTKDGKVDSSAVFCDGDMTRERTARPTYDAAICFKNAVALWRYLLKQDILESILQNEVDVDGNLNCIYKFEFMVTDLKRRLGIA